ncbi:MAG TPA: cytochrome c oxidase subunit II [Thermoanaerobaculia bacterium]|nr:cytochrome c oxidase subunit II [Thermoanaerobaculia bacterium]
MREFLAKYMPPDYSAHGPALDQLNAVVHWLMLILFIVWGLLFAYMLWRFRASRQQRALYHGTHSHLSTYAEAGVAVVEVILLVGFSIPLWYRWTQRPEPSKNPIEVRVVAEQFAWNVHYPGADGVFGKMNMKLVSSSNPLGLDPSDPTAKDDVVSLNQLHMEVNRPIIVRLTSKDVIHSFFLPYMRVKQDAIPGMEVPVHFTPIRTGGSDAKQPWEIGCAQLCGLGHYRMRGQYQVHTKADFAKWLAEQQPAVANISG